MRMSRSLVAPLAALLLAAACAATATDDNPDGSGPEATATTASPLTSTAPPRQPPLPSTSVPPAPPIGALRPPAPGRDPAGLAAQIETAETTIRDPAATELAVAAAALAQQVAYRQLGAHPEWEAAVLDSLPAGLRETARLNAAARREFRAMHVELSSTLPAWRIVPPAPAEELLADYREAEATFGIPWQYLAAIHLVETGTGRIRGTSTAGAQGPMQFLPETWARYGDGGDIDDTHDAVMGAARYLAANDGERDISAALYRYNRSPHYVLGVRIYADLMIEHPRAFLGYYHWGVIYLTDQGDVYLPVGYDQPTPIPVGELPGV